MGKLKAPLRDFLEDPLDSASLERMARTVSARRSTSKRPSSKFRAVLVPAVLCGGAAVIVCVIMGLIWLFNGSGEEVPDSGQLRLASGEQFGFVSVPEQAQLGRRLEFNDGSTIELSPGAAFETTSNNSDVVELNLLRGGATFDVRQAIPRRWIVNAGDVIVEVVGTRFRVVRAQDEQDEQETWHVSVSRGSVVVRSTMLARGRQYLEEGETLELPSLTAEQRNEPEDNTCTSDSENDGGTNTVDGLMPADADPRQSESPSPRQPQRRTWRVLAERGEYQDAYEQLGSAGLARETSRAVTMAELLALADVARRSGHPREAVAPLEKALLTHPSDRRAPVAAFTLGRLELDVFGRPSRAARAFEQCIELGAPRALRADAYARLAIARQRTGNLGGARTAAEHYLLQYPQGRRAGEMRRIIHP